MSSIGNTFCRDCQKNFEFAWFTTTDNCIDRISEGRKPAILLKDFVESSRSPLQLVTARLSKIRKCAICSDKLNDYLNDAFRIPYIWFTDWCKLSGSYFGHGDTYNEIEQVDGHNSWFRFEIKQTTPGNLEFDNTQKKKDYQWWITNVFVHWDAATGNSTMLLIDPLPKVKKIIEDTLTKTLQSPAHGLARADLRYSPYYAASLFADVAILIEHQGVWGIRNLIRKLEESRSERLNKEPLSEELHEALRHTIHVREILQTQVSDMENILAAHDRWLKDHSQTTGVANGDPSNVQPNHANSQRPVSPVTARSTPSLTGQNLVSSPVQIPANRFDDSRRPPHTTNQQIRYRLYNAINALRSQLNRSHANEARLNNEIGLGYHLLQSDIASAAQEDSSSMNKLAYLGTAFLPSTFVATLFSMSFFGTTDNGDWIFHQDRFWLFWAAAIPLTLIAVISVVWVNFNKLGERIQDSVSGMLPGRPEATDTKPTTEHYVMNGRPIDPTDQARDTEASHPITPSHNQTPRISRQQTQQFGPVSRRFSHNSRTNRSIASPPIRQGTSRGVPSFMARPTHSNRGHSTPATPMTPVGSAPPSSPPPPRSDATNNHHQQQQQGLGLTNHLNGV